jgi:hypothetical protein
LGEYCNRRFAALALGLLVAGCGGGSGSAPQAPQIVAVSKADPAPAFTGHGGWWSPTEPGTGFFVEAQGAVAVVTFFAFDTAGRPTWVSAAGSFVPNGSAFRFEGQLQRFTGGQRANAVLVVTPTAQAVGPVSITFNGSSAQVSLPQRKYTAQKFAATTARAAGLQPETGIYWNPDQSGRGYTVEAVGETLTVTMFHYDDRGEPTWHLAGGALRNGAFSGAFQRYTGGQTLEGPYVAPGAAILDGMLAAAFSDACQSTLWLPGMMPLPVRRFPFGSLPAGAECRTATGDTARTQAHGPASASRQTVLAPAAVGFVQPAAVAIDAGGNAYVVDEGAHVVFKITREGYSSVLAGVIGETGSTNGRGAAARFDKPTGLAIDAQGVLYVSDSGNLSVRKILPDGTVSTVLGRPGESGLVDGPAASVRFTAPGRLKADGQGNLFLADGAALRKIAPDFSVTTLVGGLSVSTRTLGDGPNAGFYQLQGVAVDAAGQLVVTELDIAGRGWLRKFDATGRALALAGTADGTLRLAVPTDVAVDESGNIYLLTAGPDDAAGLLFQALYKLTPNGVMTLYGGAALPAYTVPGDVQLRLGRPMGLALDPAAPGGRRILVADRTGTLWQVLP